MWHEMSWQYAIEHLTISRDIKIVTMNYDTGKNTERIVKGDANYADEELNFSMYEIRSGKWFVFIN